MRQSQRLFLQTLMSKQFLSEKETKDVYKKACAEFGDDSPPENFAGFLDAINKNLRAFDMEIRRGVSEDDALHIAPDLEKKMAITHAEKLIGKLVKDNWMSESSGSYSLGPRAMLELHPYLNRVYEDDVVQFFGD
ncbi:Non-structural maintenance of chromosomes element 1-like protein [Acropora cervicornis]|uniref:Non-structural maintenance of chromosomes element 1 homolog n=1 Tax=Acropora cervicornis TaxID=6130 RepID=A0AAD9QJ77_ACRCE|nr:Non-structural maintenance of chromosomes element 1-like protein [Acropora cervicornis]